MTTLLRIDTSLRTSGSVTRALADRAEARWRKAHPGGEVVQRDLGASPVPHLTAADLAAPQLLPLGRRLIDELRGAQDVLLAVPLHNFGVPSTLKAWIDQVVRSGETFRFEDGHLEGCLGGRRVVVIAAAGGHGDLAHGEHVARVFRFLGCDDIEVIAVEGTAAPDGGGSSLAEAEAAIDGLFEGGPRPERPEHPERPGTRWIGAFSADDRRAIEALRVAQSAAILGVDAEAYAGLCTDDVQLLLAGHDPVSGRAAFLATERRLLGSAAFDLMEQEPITIQRIGDTVVEVGHQRLGVRPSAGRPAGFGARRHYVHVLRHTPAGWRFSVLTSGDAAAGG
jgi:FMN-dependent NADH-azoreductase